VVTTTTSTSLAASPAVSTASSRATSPAGAAVSASLRQQWQRVADCEEGGRWDVQGPLYSGIGFLNQTWDDFGGLVFAPNAGMATPDEQIIVGMRVTGGWVPDQNGCAAW